MLADYWTKWVLSLIGSKIGRPMYMDKLTRTRERVTYASLLVEVDMNGEHADGVLITLPTGAHVDLAVKFEAMQEFARVVVVLGTLK